MLESVSRRCAWLSRCSASRRVSANAALGMVADGDPRVQFQASLTLGELKDARRLGALATLAHQRSADPWFRMAILSSSADAASPFFHA